MRSPISRPSFLLRVVPSLLATLLLLLTSCGGEVGLLLDIGAWPAQAETLRIRCTFNGVAGTEQIIPREQTRFVVYVPEGSVGPLVLEIVALNSQSCKVASGQLDRDIGAWFPSIREHSVTMAAITPAACTLTVHTPGGTVTMVGSAVVCPASDIPCEVERPFGSTVTLTASPDSSAPDSVPLWTEGCTGYGTSCTLPIDGNRSVSLKWEPRLCSPDGWCWKNPIQGFSPSQIAFDPSGEVWLAGSGSFILRCRDKDCRRLSVPASTGSFTSISAGQDELWGVRNGLLYRCAQQSCTEVPTGQMNPLKSVAVSPTGEVWAVGSAETIVKCVGGICSGSGTNNFFSTLTSISVNKQGEMWAAGTKSRLFRCAQGESCAALPGSSAISVNSIAVNDNGTAWVHLESSLVFRCKGTSCVVLPDLPAAGSLRLAKNGAMWVVSDSPLQALRCTDADCTEVPVTAASTTDSALADSSDAVWQSVYVSTGRDFAIALMRCRDKGCVYFPTSLDTPLRTITTSPTSEGWAIDAGGALMRCRGTSCFSTSPGSGYTSPVTSIGANQQDAWAAANQQLLRCTGTDCRSVSMGLESQAYHFQVTHVASANETWVGGRFISAIPGAIVHFRCLKTTGVCTPIPTTIASGVLDLSAKGEDAWVVSQDGQIFHCNTLGCFSVYKGAPYSIRAISTDEDGTGWAVGANGMILKCSGSSCMSVASGSTSVLGAVSASKLLTLVAANPGILACIGSTCTTVSLFGTATSVNSQGEGWLVNSGGWVNYCKGATCSTIPSGTTQNLSRVRADNLGGAWVVGDGGTILYCTSLMCSVKASGTIEYLSGVDIGLDSIWVSGTSGTILQHNR